MARSGASRARRPRGPGRPRAESARDVREKLLDAATRCFERRAFGEVGIREIARSARVNPAMIAYYFGGKRGLYQAMLESVATRLLAEMRSLAASLPPGADGLDRVLHVYQGVLARSPWFPRLIVREVLMGDGSLRAHFVEHYASEAARLLPAILRHEIEAGRLRPDLDPVLTLLSIAALSIFPYLAAPLLGPLLGFQLDDAFRERLLAHTRRLLAEGIRAPKETP